MAERGLATKPDWEQAQELVDLLPQLDVDVTLLAEESFRRCSPLSTSVQPSNQLGTS